MFKVKALYDFVASHPDDLAFNQGEVLTITNSDYAEGWFFGRSSTGKEGMIPSAYVDPLPPSMPPPPLPGTNRVIHRSSLLYVFISVFMIFILERLLQ